MLWWWKCRTTAWWYGTGRPACVFALAFGVRGLAYVGGMYLPQPTPLPQPTRTRLTGPPQGHPERVVAPRLARTETKRLTAMVLR